MTKRAFISPETAQQGGGRLEPGEAYRLCVVLRAGKGDEIELLDGLGGRYTARITTAGKRSCSVEIIERLPSQPPPPVNLTLGVSFPDKKRSTLMMRMLVELGVTTIFHLDCARSEWETAAVEKQQKRLESVVRETCKQSGRAILMKIAGARSLEEICAEVSGRANLTALLASTRERLHRIKNRLKPRQAAGKILAIIGPVGDFTEDEYRLAEQAGFQPVTLGKYVLRVETAAVAVAARILE